MRKNPFAVIVLGSLILGALLPLEAQSSAGNGFSLEVRPGFDMPIGAWSTAQFSFGGGAGLEALYNLPTIPALSLRAGVDYSLERTRAATNLTLLTLAAGVEGSISPLARLSLSAAVVGGYGLGLYKGEMGGSPFLGADAGFGYAVSPAFSLGLGAGYRLYPTDADPFYQGLRIRLGSSYRFGSGAAVKPRLEISEVRFDPVFPVFYKHYDDHPVGTVRLRNGERGAIRDVRVSLFVGQYMEQAKENAPVAELKKGEEKEIPLYGLFTDRILSLTEATKVTATVKVSYRSEDRDLSIEQSQTLRLYDRNAMSWDDDRHAAAFVTAKDTQVLAFAKAVAGLVREQGGSAVNLNFRVGLGMFEAEGLYGLSYVVDPQSAYAAFSKNEAAVDYLQYPAQTLSFKAGDCDDLSILYCALLESAGIETAFITVPGHIYAAFSLGVAAEEAGRLLANPADVLTVKGRAWVPVEVTMVQEGFLRAWGMGLREWREAEAAGTAAFYPVHEAWNAYEPVGLPDVGGKTGEAPDGQRLLARFRLAMTALVEREIGPKVTELQKALAARRDDPKLLNALGVLYAQYGLLERAAEPLEKAGAQGYVPALVNLGNCRLLLGDGQRALDSFLRAQAAKPGDEAVLVGLTRSYAALGRQPETQASYELLKKVAPQAADRYAYLSSAGGAESGRASAVGRTETVLWDLGE
jgi:hypothetical protein